MVEYKDDRPTVICLVGVNGSGKTTTTAKLGSQCMADGRQVLVAACDTFRAAAIEQLKEWSNRLELDIVSGERSGCRSGGL